MKKFVSGIMAGIILALCVSVFAQNAEIIIEKLPLKYIFNGVEKTPVEGEEGFIYNDRTYVPIRFISESLGKEVLWNEENYTIDISDKEKNLTADRGKLYEIAEMDLTKTRYYKRILTDLNCSEEQCHLYVKGVYDDYVIVEASVEDAVKGHSKSYIYRCSLRTEESVFMTNSASVVPGIDGVVEGKYYVHSLMDEEKHCSYVEVIDILNLEPTVRLYNSNQEQISDGSIFYISNAENSFELRMLALENGTETILKTLPDNAHLKIFKEGMYTYCICTDIENKEVYYYEIW